VRLIPIGSNILTETSLNFECDFWRKKAGASDNDFLLAHFGFMNNSKGVDTLLHALFQLRAQNIPAKLVMIGGRVGASDATNADYAQKIDALITDLNLSDCITWTGYVTEREVSAFLRAADVITLPFLDGASYRRGSLMAAIHHGCAIITTQPQVAIPQFEHEKNMLLVPPNHPEALTEAVLYLYQSATLRTTLQAGALDLRQAFDWNVIATQTVDFFQKIIALSR
jgi:glycosyltransferase involved in cell wall biosynthesis